MNSFFKPRKSTKNTCWYSRSASTERYDKFTYYEIYNNDISYKSLVMFLKMTSKPTRNPRLVVTKTIMEMNSHNKPSAVTSRAVYYVYITNKNSKQCLRHKTRTNKFAFVIILDMYPSVRHILVLALSTN